MYIAMFQITNENNGRLLSKLPTARTDKKRKYKQDVDEEGGVCE